MRHVECSQVWITEWYDGMVQGVIEDASGCYWYLVLQAFDATDSRRLYALVEINSGLASEMNLTTGAAPKPNVSDLDKVFKGDNIFITTDKPEEGVHLKLKTITDAQRRRLKKGGFQIENAVSEKAIKFWFSERPP